MIADVGTRLTYSSKFSFSQYKAALSPYSANASLTLSVRSWNWCIVIVLCAAKVSWVFLYSSFFHSKHLSILFKAIIKGHCFYLRSSIDSSVCCSILCIKSTTKMAISHREEPRDLKFVNDSWPGVSITKKPGNFKSRGMWSPTFSICPSMYSYGK